MAGGYFPVNTWDIHGTLRPRVNSLFPEKASSIRILVSRKRLLVSRSRFLESGPWLLENGLSGTATVSWKGAFRKRFIVSCKRHHGKGFQKRVSPRARAQQRFGRACARAFPFCGEPRARKVGLLGPGGYFFLSTRTFYNRNARACAAEPLFRKRLRGRTFLCARSL